MSEKWTPETLGRALWEAYIDVARNCSNCVLDEACKRGCPCIDIGSMLTKLNAPTKGEAE